MLRRKVLSKLFSWKTEHKNKCLVISGPRQVGKTYIVRRLGETYSSYIELNFIEKPELSLIFKDSLRADDIFTGIKLNFPDKQIIPGETLILLDEIQECANAITALKLLANDNKADVIATGSLLGLRYKGNSSYPVGSVDYLDMYSLDFEEFLWAMGIDDEIIALLKNHYAEKKMVPHAIHKKMMNYLKQYMVLGGMPEVINTFLDKKDYHAADSVQRSIYRDYIADIARYAEPNIKIKAEKCYKSIPLQLSKDNHKFQYSVVEHKGNAKKFETSLDWIINANMVAPVLNVNKTEYPLAAFALDDNIRLYNTDIGLLICTYDFSLKKALLEDDDFYDNALSNPILKVAKGGIYEALIAEMLVKAGCSDIFFYRNNPGTVEIEFLLDKSDGVLPIEVKAGHNRTKSLDSILKCDSIPYGIKFADQNVGISGKKITMPLYMAIFLTDSVDDR